MIPNISSDWVLELRIFLRNVYSHLILISNPNFLRKMFYSKNVSLLNSKYGLPYFRLPPSRTTYSVLWSDTKKVPLISDFNCKPHIEIMYFLHTLIMNAVPILGEQIRFANCLGPQFYRFSIPLGA